MPAVNCTDDHDHVTLQNSTTMSGDGNATSTNNGPPKQQGGTPLPFLDHDFKSYYNTEWYQWELNVQLKAT
eukprot:5189139-Ditylum_brightwellii.AAC.1